MRSVPIVAILLVLALGLDACAEAAAPLAGTAFTNWVQMRFVRIEPGEFVMGQGDAPPRTRDEWLQRDYDEAPAHRVRISKPFYLAIHEVTNAQYGQYDPRHRERWAGKGAGSQDTDPVTFVTWQQAVAYCDWLSKREGRPYRLPTEAEWEYACRAGTTTPWNTGERITAQQANLGLAKDGRSRQGVVAVGSYPANGWGLFDVHGNVAEWCSDWYGPYEPGLQCDPVGRSDGYARVVRGWSWQPTGSQDASRFTRCANRSGHLPEDANRYTGFRVACGALPSSKPLPAVVLPYQKDVKQHAAPKQGPDPTRPFFQDFKKAGKAPTLPKDLWGPLYSWNHFTAVCACPNGDILAAWYTTIAESGRECAQAASRLAQETIVGIRSPPSSMSRM